MICRRRGFFFLFLSTIIILSCSPESKTPTAEVLVIGQGTGATSAAIQSARSGVKTTLLNPISWLGGMHTAAGVSATDGNHNLPAGLWGEFRDSLREHYGGADSLFTGWVSNTMFEPKVGDYYWKQIATQEANLTILYNADFTSIGREGDLWKVNYNYQNQKLSIKAKVLVDGTDLGDVAAVCGATFDIGMDSQKMTGEAMAPSESNDIIQDLTYAAILKDYGADADKTIEKPDNYDASQFYCACDSLCDDPEVKPHPCETMLSYGKLPNGKYMINWPLKGNDYYANIIEKSKDERRLILNKAKNKTLQFIYFIQTELGYKNLGIADDEFPTEDGLPLMPYHREGRRIHGLVQMNVNHILKPYDHILYRTGIAVGDYPIDHHHYERPDAPEIDFPKVPSFNIPMGALIPKSVDDILIADKAISVTNIVNGSTRLQPVIIQIGQAAGIMAAMSIKGKKSPKELDIREVQKALLGANGYLMPLIDVSPQHPHFQSIQKVAASGLMRATGIPYKWANQTWFYPDEKVKKQEFYKNLSAFYPSFNLQKKEGNNLNYGELLEMLSLLKKTSHRDIQNQIKSITNIETEWDSLEENYILSREELAVVFDVVLNPFSRKVDVYGRFTK